MNRPPETRLTPEIAREICERTGSAAVLEGSIAGLGSQYVLWLRARNCRTGDVLAQEQAQAGRKEEVLNALSRDCDSNQDPAGRVARHHPGALDAAGAGNHVVARSSEGVQCGADRPVRAWRSCRDPPFSARHRHRSAIRDGACRFAIRVLEHGPNRSGRRGHPQSLRASGSRQRSGKALHPDSLRPAGNRETCRRSCRLSNRGCRRILAMRTPWAVLAGWGRMGTGQYERGIQAAQEAIRLDPDIPFPYAIWLSTISSSTGSRRPRMSCSGRRSANWKFRNF